VEHGSAAMGSLVPKFVAPGVIEKNIAHLDKMQENDLALTFEDQRSNVNALC
jgi:hypothetical protein